MRVHSGLHSRLSNSFESLIDLSQHITQRTPRANVCFHNVNIRFLHVIFFRSVVSRRFRAASLRKRIESEMKDRRIAVLRTQDRDRLNR